MGKTLPPKENELYQRADEVLHYLWDPIGVAGIPEARDEYYSYLPGVFSLVLEQAGEKAIADYLLEAERSAMGLAGRPDQALEVARVLERYRDLVFDDVS